MLMEKDQLREQIRFCSGPVDVVKSGLPDILQGYGLHFFDEEGWRKYGPAGSALVMEQEACCWYFCRVILMVSIHDSGCPVVLELARNLSILRPSFSLVYLFHDGEVSVEEVFPELKRESEQLYVLLLRVLPERNVRWGECVLAVSSNDADPYLPAVVLGRMRHHGLLPLFRGPRTPLPAAALRQLTLQPCAPLALDGMCRLARWLEEFLFVLDDTLMDHLFPSEEDCTAETDPLELEARFFKAAFPKRAAEIMTGEGKICRARLEEELEVFFGAEERGGEMSLFG